MLPLRMNFRGMKKQAGIKIKLLEKANPEREVIRAIKALKRVIDVLENGCGGMGFRVTFKKAGLVSPRRRAPGKRASRA